MKRYPKHLMRHAALFTLLTGVCLDGARAQAEPQAPACGTPSPFEVPGTPIASAQIDAAVAQVDTLAQRLMSSTGIPGMAVAVVRDGRTVFAKGYGVRSVDSAAPVDADTVFQLASVSKSVGATVVAHQVGIGEASWDMPLFKTLPWFGLSDWYAGSRVTVADMYAHRSGLPEHAGDLLEDLGFSRFEGLVRLRQFPLSPFRTVYAYTNFGMTAGAEAVAQASGSDWATLSARVIYSPLGMTSTSSRYADFLARPNRAAGHVKIDGAYRVSTIPRQPDTQSPAGGVSSSVNDMARWMNMVLGLGKVDGETIVECRGLLPALSPHMVMGGPARPQERASAYGYGFIVGNSAAGHVTLSHSGAFALGAATAYTLIPSQNVGIVTLTNAIPVGVPETLNAEFVDLVQFGKLTMDWRGLYAAAFEHLIDPTGELAGKTPPPNPVPAAPLERYRGDYDNRLYGRATVETRDGKLTLLLGPKRTSFALTHWNADTFVFVPPGESAPPGSLSQVTFGANGLTIEYLDAEGLGKFRRRTQ